jgi:hypothetical protein
VTSGGEPVELLRYAEGTDLVGELRAEVARERGPAQPCLAYLLDVRRKSIDTDLTESCITGVLDYLHRELHTDTAG